MAANAAKRNMNVVCLLAIKIQPKLKAYVGRRIKYIVNIGTAENRTIDARNPRTGSIIYVPSKKKVFFKMSKHLKEEINKE